MLATHWPEFATLDAERLGRLVRNKVLVDLRNFLDPQAFLNAGFAVHAIGRPPQQPRRHNVVAVHQHSARAPSRRAYMNGAAQRPSPALQDGMSG